MVKFNGILSDPLVFSHPEVLQVGLGFAFQVVWTKVGPEFGNEFLVVGKPRRLFIRIHESGLKPI